MNCNSIFKKLFWDNQKQRLSTYYRKYNQNKEKYININHYLINLFKESKDDLENIYRLIFNIFEYPKCPICGKPLKFIGKPNNKGLYSKTCSKSCSAKLTNNRNTEESHIKAQQTKLEIYGNLNNFGKAQKTKLDKYGNLNNFEKIKQTKLERYDNENYNNRNKCKQTKLERYGNENYVNPNKAKQTKLERYGDKNYNNAKQTQQTNLEKYGFKAGFNDQEKCKKTKLEKYGDENYNNREQAELKRDYEAIKKHTDYKQIVEKSIITKRKNHTFKKSDTEDQSYILLKEKFEDVIRQYNSNLYPFACDFYIPSLDLYIECNYHWTHGGKIYEGTEEDNKQVQKWKDMNTRYYDNAIKTWTILDVNKIKIAQQNKLNYIIFWRFKELKEWLNNN